ncbi:life-span regulatory factor-domain-containing protein [Aspergillus pseudodeflectus]|uniref:Life-span regulatory factor-domain-containing protein n=1 Tax=Aspergillus pseudodeflectus TaxID=176178 RepID=A0ABR4K6B7_9EURO
MTQSHVHSHHRRTPSGSNSSKLRSARPALHRKGASYANLSISKLGSGQPRSTVVDDDRVPEMAASFLNYCAMCERQITVPDNRLLYCSESCRRKDSHKPLSASFPSYTPMCSRNTSPASSSPPLSPTIVAPMTPTKAPVTVSRPIRIPTDMHESKTDLDPTEWKPVIQVDSRCASAMGSDAWKYLSQFHSDDTMVPLRRARVDHHSSTSLSTLPSLSHTPSVASSVSSVASDYMSYRPLPPRHKPCFSGSGSAAKGVQLVVPQIAAIPDSPIDMPNGGSVFPANSGLWDEKTIEAPVITGMDATTVVSVSARN